MTRICPTEVSRIMSEVSTEDVLISITYFSDLLKFITDAGWDPIVVGENGGLCFCLITPECGVRATLSSKGVFRGEIGDIILDPTMDYEEAWADQRGFGLTEEEKKQIAKDNAAESDGEDWSVEF